MTKPTNISTSEQFLELLAKSDLLSGEQLGDAHRAAAGGGDAKGVARFLLKQGWLTTWQAGQLLCGFHRLLVGNYRLCSELGRGYWGRVYLAEHVRLGRRAAVQIVSPRHAEQPEALQLFLAETKVAAALEHRNIIRLFDVGRDGDRLYAVREFVPGQDLRQRVQKLGPLPLPLAIDWVVQTCCGLEYLHARGVVHGGLKPSSLLVSEPGVVKILDVAASARRRDFDEQPDDDASRAAIRYWSPEQIRGADPDVATDVFSLGCCLYSLLTGRVAFAVTRDDQGRPVRAGPMPVPINSHRPEVPPALAALCGRMLAARREERMGCASEVREQLEALRDSQRLSLPGSRSAARTEQVAADETEHPVAPAPSGVAGSASRELAASVAPSAVGGEQPTPGEAVGEGAAPEPRLASATRPSLVAGSSGRRLRFLRSFAQSVRGLPRTIVFGFVALAGGLFLLAVGLQWGLNRTSTTAVATLPDGRGSARAAPGDSPFSPPDEQPEAEIAEQTMSHARAQPASQASSGGAADDADKTPATEVAATGAVEAVPPAPETQDGSPLPASPEVPAPPEESPAKAPMTATPPEKPASDKPALEKPVSEKPAPQITAEAGTAQPVFEIASAVDLPPLPTSSQAESSAVLGKIRVGAQDACFISLFGGENALRGRAAISLRSARDGTAPRDWEIVLSDSSGQEAVLASLALPEQDLRFTWSGEAAQRSVAECVRNCGLKITAGQVSPQEVVLRTPVLAPPLTLDFDKPALSAKWTIDGLPDPEAIRVAARIEGYPFILEPAAAIPADAGTQWVYLGDNREQVAIALQLRTNLSSRGLELSLLPCFFVPGQPLPDRMTKAKVNQFRTACLEGKSQRPSYQALVEQLQKAQKTNRKSEVQNPLLQANAAVSRIDALLQRLEQLERTLKAINGQAKLHVRVYLDTGAKEVDLLLTNASPPAAAAGE